MTSSDRVLRPSATEVISHLHSDRTPTERTFSPLKHSINELLSIIDDLRRQVAEKDLIIETLTKKQ